MVNYNIKFNTPAEQIPESSPEDKRSPEERRECQVRHRIEDLALERELKARTAEVWDEA
jgi:hypothetical protein